MDNKIDKVCLRLSHEQDGSHPAIDDFPHKPMDFHNELKEQKERLGVNILVVLA